MNNSYKLSILQSLSPITKGLLCIIYILLFSLFCKTLYMSLTLLFFIMFSVVLFKENIIELFISLKKIWVLLLVVGLFQGFIGSTFNYLLALNVIIKIIGIFFSATLYSKLSTQNELLYFWEICFKPLNLIGVSSSELALTMVIAIRFLPVFMDEIERIKIAQIARGAKITKSSIARAINFMPLLIPVLTQAIMRSEELADAMEARGFVPNKPRGRYRNYTFSKYDYLALFITVIVCLSSIASYIYY